MTPDPKDDPRPMPGVRVYCSYEQTIYADGTVDLWVDRPTVGWFGRLKHKLVQVTDRVPVNRALEILGNEFKS